MSGSDQRWEIPSSLNKEKYWQILRTQGLSAALTQLHHDKEQLEFVLFEGEKGYRPELLPLREQYCAFSRELWDTQVACD